jgi:hypothetical protein
MGPRVTRRLNPFNGVHLALRYGVITNNQPSPDFDALIDGFWAAAHRKKVKLAGSKGTKKCHYMPQFLMRRWIHGGKLRIQNIATKTIREFPATAKGKISIGLQKDLYTTYDGSDIDRVTLEAFLESIEGQTAEALRSLASNDWKMECETRKTLALFVASTVLRLPAVLLAVQVEYQPDFEEIVPGAKQVTGHTAQALLQLKLKEFTKTLFANPRWAIVRFPPDRRQSTGDIPLIAATHDGAKLGNDFGTWELGMPLDPSALLLINGRSAIDVYFPSGTLDGNLPCEWNPLNAKHRIL